MQVVSILPLTCDFTFKENFPKTVNFGRVRQFKESSFLILCTLLIKSSLFLGMKIRSLPGKFETVFQEIVDGFMETLSAGTHCVLASDWC